MSQYGAPMMGGGAQMGQMMGQGQMGMPQMGQGQMGMPQMGQGQMGMPMQQAGGSAARLPSYGPPLPQNTAWGSIPKPNTTTQYLADEHWVSLQ